MNKLGKILSKNKCKIVALPVLIGCLIGIVYLSLNFSMKKWWQIPILLILSFVTLVTLLLACCVSCNDGNETTQHQQVLQHMRNQQILQQRIYQQYLNEQGIDINLSTPGLTTNVNRPVMTTSNNSPQEINHPNNRSSHSSLFEEPPPSYNDVMIKTNPTFAAATT